MFIEGRFDLAYRPGRLRRADKQSHIAISIDMLDTGIDIPEVVNHASQNSHASGVFAASGAR